MKKVYPILLVGILAFSGFGAFGISNDNPISNINYEPAPEITIDVHGGFAITMIYKNVGDATATNVSSYIGIFGGWCLSKNTNIKHLGDIAPGKSVIVRFRYFGLGFGLNEDAPQIQAKAWYNEGSYEVDIDALVIFSLIILR